MEISNQERIDLKRLITESQCEDNTVNIRELKHSSFIRNDIQKLAKLVHEQGEREDLSIEEFDQLTKNSVPFLVNHYFDIYIRIMKKELNFEIMARVLNVLATIEDGKVDQHEGSVIVGKILKELYLDSAIRRGENLDKQYAEEKPVLVTGKPISWKTYKKNSLP
jgi:hypothetical protein